VIDIALERGYEITNLDFRPPRLSKYHHFWQNIDIRHGDKVMRAVTEFDPHRIIHLASDIDVNLKTLEEYTTILDGTRNLIAAAKKVASLERFVHVSTQYTVTPGRVPISETDLHPYTLYGVAKAKAEKQMQACGLKSWLIVRPTIIWGPFHPTFASHIWFHIANGSYLHPAASVPIRRTYGYVYNTADQMVRLMEADELQLVKRVYYLGDELLDYEMWANAFALRLTGKRTKRVPICVLWALGMIGSTLKSVGINAPYDRGRYFRMTTSSPVDLDPTFTITGKPQISFDEGVERSVAWLFNCTDFKDFAISR
jgi:nucleoside-diphosphate-sugar epimerase